MVIAFAASRVPCKHEISIPKEQLATSVLGSGVLGGSVPWNNKLKGRVQLYICFQLGNSFGNISTGKKTCMRFQLGNSFGNAKVERKVQLDIRFQLGN